MNLTLLIYKAMPSNAY